MAFRKLLCPIDFSPGSQQALTVATRIARKTGAELVIAHAWHLPARAFLGDYPIPDRVIQQMIDEAVQALDDVAKREVELGLPRGTTRLLRGVPWEQIADAARADPAIDAIVMGTHGRSGIARVFLGSVTEQVIRHAPCSVLAIREKGSTLPFPNILCPIDFSDDSRHAIGRAAELAALGATGIKLMHVIEPALSYNELSMGENHLAALDHRATHELVRWASDLGKKVSVPVTTAIDIGRPGAQILAALDADPSIDLVIMGSHGRTGIKRVLLGSVAEKVLRHASCPVWIERSRTA
ncbi:MAG TPA: universal stress protein [Kofleriaceae bacterium]|jgi:nucleotide-binding universal stress UspA family protein|nr:universal stress protein [Kofleriaceae bacterium]